VSQDAPLAKVWWKSINPQKHRRTKHYVSSSTYWQMADAQKVRQNGSAATTFVAEYRNFRTKKTSPKASHDHVKST